MLKSLLATPLFQLIVGRVLGLYMKLAAAGTRWRQVDREIAEQVWSSGGPVIACVWHGRIFQVHQVWQVGKNAQPARILISQSREGEIVAQAARVLGVPVTRGSSAKGGQQKGGFEAMREMLRHLNANGCMCIAPDGPRGPRMRAQMGPIQLAKLSGAPIICLAWSNGRKPLGTWDRLLLPNLFGRGVLMWGGPIHVPRDSDSAAMDAARLALEAELNRITMEADRLAGGEPVQPDAGKAIDPEPAPP